MRIIAGKARRLLLKTPYGMDTRPTTDQIKETLFNILEPRIYGIRFLDLFAGSGQMGLEAISRGADFAVFVEQDKRAAKCIEENIEHTGFAEQSRLLNRDVVTSIRMLDGGEPFDVIFMDPPYGKSAEKNALLALSRSNLIAEDGLIIVEASQETDFSYLARMGLAEVRRKYYRTNMHVFIERQKDEESNIPGEL
ncbi:MAG: 16S rRNA (guanine(966)-N(2))-methyltransferase RsmD [Clostridiales bacterium]|nr:16S rRNA (guanine(966)-N(2))-methyltransferase RsmD [Clostridiales bacterium]